MCAVALFGSPSSQHDVSNHINNPPSYEIRLLNGGFVPGKTAANQDLIVDERADVACVTETWLGKGRGVNLSRLCPLGYLLIYQLRYYRQGNGVSALQ